MPDDLTYFLAVRRTETLVRVSADSKSYCLKLICCGESILMKSYFSGEPIGDGKRHVAKFCRRAPLPAPLRQAQGRGQSRATHSTMLPRAYARGYSSIAPAGLDTVVFSVLTPVIRALGAGDANPYAAGRVLPRAAPGARPAPARRIGDRPASRRRIRKGRWPQANRKSCRCRPGDRER